MREVVQNLKTFKIQSRNVDVKTYKSLKAAINNLEYGANNRIYLPILPINERKKIISKLEKNGFSMIKIKTKTDEHYFRHSDRPFKLVVCWRKGIRKLFFTAPIPK